MPPTPFGSSGRLSQLPSQLAIPATTSSDISRPDGRILDDIVRGQVYDDQGVAGGP
jgi:hypothetical protein